MILFDNIKQKILNLNFWKTLKFCLWGLILLIFTTIGWIAGYISVNADVAKSYEKGYREAYFDHVSGKIDCVVIVKHPEWTGEKHKQ